MISHFQKARRRTLICGAAIAAVLAATPALAQEQLANIDIAAQPMDSALKELAKQSGANLLFSPDAVRGLRAKSLQTTATPEDAARMLLAGTDLFVKRDATGSLLVDRADPQSGSAAGDGADGTVAALIVTAQKREENIQDVPIAISAFSEKSLQEQKIEGGFDLLKAIPNVTFSKNNFTSYNFSIRGIGTKAVSATTDPGVAVSFNNIALLQNRLFEQEYFDVERVEVLRGPQGTLYGRNATAGVINVISAKLDMDEFKGWIKGEVGNYDTKRASAMINVPLVNDMLAVRFAGAFTDRQGYDFNTGTGHAVNGRDLWSARLTLAFNPTERIRTNLVWERFEEDDNRSRTGKQLCHRDPGKTTVGNSNIVLDPANNFQAQMFPAMLSQGCQPGSLYDSKAFGTPNGLALPFVFGMLWLGGNCGPGCFTLYPMGSDPVTGASVTLLQVRDPYGNMMQSPNLRVINSFKDPVYRAGADVVQFNADIDVTDRISLYSQTVYNKDETYSFQDFNRFNTVPIFTDTSRIVPRGVGDGQGRSEWADLAPGGILCDPQLGCSKSLAGFDIAKANGEQFTQEIRLQSDFEGPINFSAGANYTRFKTEVDYYVFYNLITAFVQLKPFLNRPTGYVGQVDPVVCFLSAEGRVVSHPDGFLTADNPLAQCPYVDPNPIESINGDGHNYFRSKNPYKLKSWAAFGEIYWQASEAIKVTAGLRYTDDKKTFIPVPSQVLLAPGLVGGGNVAVGYPEDPAIVQRWGEYTGRLGVDWKPELSFTDDTMLYAFYSRGYKGGGANPPLPDFATIEETVAQVNLNPTIVANFVSQGILPIIGFQGAEYGPTFDPEFVDAFEVGSKNVLLGGGLVLNASAFFYDYKDYQVSQIRDRSAINENFDAKVWGLEFESLFSPSRNLKFNANFGYLDTRIADGESSIDIMNRTQGNPDYSLVKPWVQKTSNCVLPTSVLENWFATRNGIGTMSYWRLCGGGGAMGIFGGPLLDPNYNNTKYDAANYPELNGGAGLRADIGGNELPNSPHWTANIGAQYEMDIVEGWRATVRGDAYWQSQSWARVYNAVNDKLHGWYNVNLSLWLENGDGLKIELYAKNLLDKTPITDAFLNSDDTALTTNVFVLDPRLIGLSIRKEF